MQIQTYLFFGGRCEEAIEFYRKHLGAEVQLLMRNKDSPEPHAPGMLPPGSDNKIMHATLRIGESALMLSDGLCKGEHFDGFSLSLNPADRGEAERIFAALSEGGQVRMPLTKTFWSPLFGMLTDRFGVGWMISLAQ